MNVSVGHCQMLLTWDVSGEWEAVLTFVDVATLKIVLDKVISCIIR
jgi:hypothetical protein